ncbi:unnamed protein product [Mesocestoides corti]|uniref:EGF-like domain-containing protein n=1 Tax=Mesocestoides corti TaxID=53468 RepID=A0A0R3UIL6_MESCO|nr:unnamed protein product [Mesocestoides corti]
MQMILGFFGEYCNHSNVCLREPCAPGAECVAKLAGRICICNGGDHPECYPENDPCAMSPCLNGGECGRSLTNPRGFICSCPKYYTGTFCEQRLSVCALAEEEGSSLMRETFTMTRRNAEQSEGTNNAMPETALCLNGGICVDHPKLFTYFCDCPKEWTGKRCEKRVIEVRL